MNPTRYRLMPPGNPYAFWAVIVGVVGFCVPFVGGVSAVVLGVVGVIRSQKTLEGRGPAIAGIVLGGISIASSYAVYSGIHMLIRAAR